MAGGAGNDTYIVDNAGDVVTEAVGEGTDTVLASVSYTLAAGYGGRDPEGECDDRPDAHRQRFANNLIGNVGNDTLIGGGGNDALNGGAGADTMAGGAGNDTYFVDNAGDVVNEAVGEGTDTVLASVSYTLAAGSEVESLRANATAGLTLTGNEFSHNLVGNVGNDTLIGGAGNDTLNGGAGADTMAGGAGNDTYFVDNAGDVVNEAAGQGTDTVFASVNYSLTAGSEIEFLRANAGATGLSLTGNALANRHHRVAPATTRWTAAPATTRWAAGRATTSSSSWRDLARTPSPTSPPTPARRATRICWISADLASRPRRSPPRSRSQPAPGAPRWSRSAAAPTRSDSSTSPRQAST